MINGIILLDVMRLILALNKDKLTPEQYKRIDDTLTPGGNTERTGKAIRDVLAEFSARDK